MEYRDICAEHQTGAVAQLLGELDLILKQGQYHRMEEWLNDLFLYFVRNNGLDIAYAWQVYLEVYQKLYEEGLGLKAASSLLKQHADYRERIYSIDTLYLMNAYLFKLLDFFPSSTPAGSHGLSEPIKTAVSYIECHFSDPAISLESVADYLHFNAAYISRLFKRETGKGFLEFLTTLRIDKAKQKLVNRGNESLQVIAESVGYLNYNHFSKTFKKMTGKSPSDYVS